MVPNVPSDPDSDPCLSYSSLSDSSDLSDDDRSKQRQRKIIKENIRRSKNSFYPIKNFRKLTSKLLTAAYKLNIK